MDWPTSSLTLLLVVSLLVVIATYIAVRYSRK